MDSDAKGEAPKGSFRDSLQQYYGKGRQSIDELRNYHSLLGNEQCHDENHISKVSSFAPTYRPNVRPDFGQAKTAQQVVTASDEAHPLTTSALSPTNAACSSTLRSAANIVRGWWREFVFWVISVIALGGLILVLKKYDNQPLPSWPSQITLNTIVALLSTVARATLLEPVVQSLSQYKWIWFQKKRPLKDYAAWDEASRGALGSLSLVFTTRIQIFSILTAFLLISSLLTATVTQATITYSLRPKPATAQGAQMQKVAEVAAIVGDRYDLTRANSGVNMGIRRGLLAPLDEALLFSMPRCQTANCTWSSIETVAVCADMRNVTTNLTLTKHDITPPPSPGSPTQFLNISYNHDGGPYMVYKPVYVESGKSAIHVGDKLAFEKDNYTGEVDYDGTRVKERSTDIFHFFYTRYAGSLRGTEFLFRWCVNTYNVSVTNNIPKVEVLSSSYDYGFGNFSDRKYETDLMYLKSPNNTSTRYLLAGWTPGIVSSYMNSTLVGEDLIQPGYSMESGFDLFDSALHDFRFNRSMYQTSKELDQAQWDRMWNVSQNIAASLTNYFLNQDVEGTAWEMEPFVSVRWEWLSLIAVQIGLSIVVLIFSIIATARSGLSIMKASPLPAFFAISAEEKMRLHDKTDVIGDASTKNMVKANGVAGRLREDGNLWKLE